MGTKMTAYLIYAPREGERNREFIRMFQEEGRKQGISFSYVSLEEYRQRDVPEVVLNRTRLPEVSRWYEERGCLALHDTIVVEIANDKWKTLLYLLRHADNGGIFRERREKWLPDTFHLPAEGRDRKSGNLRWEKCSCIAWREGRECLLEMSLDEFLAYHSSLVIKTVSGHGGNQVICIGEGKTEGEVRREIWEFMERFPREDVILQEKVACRSRDVRMYILGNRMYQGVLRQGREDFRSNYSLGGEVSAFWPSREQEAWMSLVLKGFGKLTLGMAGMDFLLGEDGNLYFNELEEMVGCRMLYQATDQDIVKDYVEWIVNI